MVSCIHFLAANSRQGLMRDTGMASMEDSTEKTIEIQQCKKRKIEIRER